jgi:hypothetical protein
MKIKKKLKLLRPVAEAQGHVFDAYWDLNEAFADMTRANLLDVEKYPVSRSDYGSADKRLGQTIAALERARAELKRFRQQFDKKEKRRARERKGDDRASGRGQGKPAGTKKVRGTKRRLGLGDPQTCGTESFGSWSEPDIRDYQLDF